MVWPSCTQQTLLDWVYFQHDQADDQIAALLVTDELVLGHDVLQHRLVGNIQILAALFKGHAEHGAGLQRLRLVVSVDLDDGVVALLLALQHFQRVSVVAGAMMPSETSC